jgi:hypothetical protein
VGDDIYGYLLERCPGLMAKLVREYEERKK